MLTKFDCWIKENGWINHPIDELTDRELDKLAIDIRSHSEHYSAGQFEESMGYSDLAQALLESDYSNATVGWFRAQAEIDNLKKYRRVYFRELLQEVLDNFDTCEEDEQYFEELQLHNANEARAINEDNNYG